MNAQDEEERVRREVAEISSRLDKKVDSLRRDNSSWEFEFKTASGHRMTLPVEEIVQAWQPNRLGFFGKLGVTSYNYG